MKRKIKQWWCTIPLTSNLVCVNKDRRFQIYINHIIVKNLSEKFSCQNMFQFWSYVIIAKILSNKLSCQNMFQFWSYDIMVKNLSQVFSCQNMFQLWSYDIMVKNLSEKIELPKYVPILKLRHNGENPIWRIQLQNYSKFLVIKKKQQLKIT